MRTPRIYFLRAEIHTPTREIHRLQSVAPAVAELRRGDVAMVTGLAEATALKQGANDAALLTRLRDLGFTAGARCEVMARMWLGGDPLVVRVGGSTFALRRAEASAVRVQRLQEQVRPSAALEPKDASAATA